jgi:CRISPR/Cas system-associated exonuclease Cas4 (RecB family)
MRLHDCWRLAHEHFVSIWTSAISGAATRSVSSLMAALKILGSGFLVDFEVDGSPLGAALVQRGEKWSVNIC